MNRSRRLSAAVSALTNARNSALMSSETLLDDFSPDGDRPAHLREFRRNIRRCKIALGGALVAALFFGSIHLHMLEPPWAKDGDWGHGQWIVAARWAVVLTTLCTTIGCTGLYTVTLIHRPFPARLRPADLGGLANMELHRLSCVLIFLVFLGNIVIYNVSDVVYTVLYKHGPPGLSTATLAAGHFHFASLLAALVAVGCMRRGPKMRATEVRVGTAFGVREESKPKFWWELDVGQEVIDYGECSMLMFLTLGYSLSLAPKSLRVPQLTQSDLPMLEEWVRTSGVQYLEDIGPHGANFEPITSMGLAKSLWSGRGLSIFITFALELLNTVISFVSITCLHEFIASFDRSDDYSYSYLMCWGMFLGQVVEVLLSAYLWVRENYLLHNPVRLALSAMLYSKILRSTDATTMEAQHLTSGEDEKANKGRAQIMNLLTIDTGTVASMATYLWGITNGLLRLAIGLVFMYKLLGLGAAVSLLCIPLIAPVSAWIAKKIYQCDKSWARARDARTGAIKEFLMGIKVIKLNAFETYEIHRVGQLRDVETGWQRWRYHLGTMFNIVTDQYPEVAMVLTFAFYAKVMGKPLVPETAFVAITVFQRVRDGLSSIPGAIDVVLTTKIALDRLKGYLNQAEVTLNPNDVSSGRILLDDATFSWPHAEFDDPSVSTPLFKLKHINLALPNGRLTIVCGPLGAGKTLFLRGLLGEAFIEHGRIMAPRSAPDMTPLESSLIKMRWTNDLWLEDSVAYAPQASYIRHGTIRDNILFGQPLWAERYQKVLQQCSLSSDLDLLVDGDSTEVGENGVNLSGGQKARINLARCIYSRARTLYLDDIMSAVDAHTAQYLVDQCLKGDLARGRTIVLVTHQVDLCLPASDYVVALDAGKVRQACRTRDATIASLKALTSSPGNTSKPLEPASPQHETHMEEALKVMRELHGLNEGTDPLVDTPDTAYELGLGDIQAITDEDAPRVLYAAEHQEKGHVSTSQYWMMIKAAGGPGYWLIFALLFLSAKVGSMLFLWVLEKWTADPAPERLDYYLLLYISINAVTGVVQGLRWVWLYGVGNVGFYSGGTKKIHRKLFATIANAPLSFFETIPMGRLLNVFAQDMKRLDSQSADDFGRTCMEVIRLVASAAVVGWDAPIMLVVLVVFGVPLILVANSLGQLRSNLRRLAAVADSPLISLYHDSIDGVVMLRAFGLPNVMAHAMKSLINRSRSAETWNWIVYNWVRAVVLSMSSVFMSATAVALISRTDINKSKAGFIMTFASQLSGNMFSLLERFILLEQTFVSAERINHFVEDTPQESTVGAQPPPSWPSEGRITVHDLNVRYAPDLPDVLHDVSFSIEPGQRVGLVGATGSGKSTLALSLFRAIEPRSGSIAIDGIDIGSIKLCDLRSRLNMVVQDGSLPSGTLRNALDITGEMADAEVYAALQRVHLLPDVITPDEVQTNPFANLATFVAPEGNNFSHGQRQLLCLARALLKQSKILVMDEATSSVDFEMDEKITATIKECFADTTMLVIAHRLATIVAYDRVLVLDRGRVLEYDRPVTLMKQEGSVFRALCRAQGEEHFQQLLDLAAGRV